MWWYRGYKGRRGEGIICAGHRGWIYYCKYDNKNNKTNLENWKKTLKDLGFDKRDKNMTTKARF